MKYAGGFADETQLPDECLCFYCLQNMYGYNVNGKLRGKNYG